MYWVCLLFDMFADISLSGILTTYRNILGGIKQYHFCNHFLLYTKKQHQYCTDQYLVYTSYIVSDIGIWQWEQCSKWYCFLLYGHKLERKRRMTGRVLCIRPRMRASAVATNHVVCWQVTPRRQIWAGPGPSPTCRNSVIYKIATGCTKCRFCIFQAPFCALWRPIATCAGWCH